MSKPRAAESAARTAAIAAPDRRIWIDGQLVPWESATVHLLSHCVQRGSLVFDYMRVYATPRGPALFRVADHVRRFRCSTDLVGLPLTLEAGEIEDAIADTVRANPGATSVKISAYLPSVEVDVVPLDDRVSVAIAAYDNQADIVALKTGFAAPAPRAELRLWIEKDRHQRRPDILPPQAKVAANYASPMVAKWAARRAGYDEIVLVDEGGFVTEGPTTNLFLVDRDATLRTPLEDQVMLGVTRRSILELAKHEGIATAEGQLRTEDLFEAAEVFLSGTTGGLTPVGSIDDRPVGGEIPGPVTRKLRERLQRVVSGADPAFEHWLRYVEQG